MSATEIIQNIKAIASVGGWVIISLFFMGQSSGYLRSPHDQNLKDMEVQMQVHAESMEEHRHRQEVLIDRLTVALRVLCENEAKGNVQATNNCLNIK